MTRTRRRLEEARFFLRQLEAAYHLQPDFDYFFNAFTSSARSVTWIMRAEYGRVAGWEEWYTSKSPDASEKNLLECFNSLRVRSQKSDPIKTKAVIIMDVPAESVTPEFRRQLEQGVGKRFRMKVYALPEPDADSTQSELPQDAVLASVIGTQRRVNELSEQDVLEASANYLNALEALVAECEALHAA